MPRFRPVDGVFGRAVDGGEADYRADTGATALRSYGHDPKTATRVKLQRAFEAEALRGHSDRCGTVDVGALAKTREFTQPRRALRRLMVMTLSDLDLLPAPGRFPFQLTDRLAVVVMTPIEDVVIVGLFFDGELVRMTEEPAGEA